MMKKAVLVFAVRLYTAVLCTISIGDNVNGMIERQPVLSPLSVPND